MKIYLVGGAVRDALLGKETNDFDYVVVGATYEEMRAKYGESVGLDFPVFLDHLTGDQYAMARRERKTGVGYHGFSCEFGNDVTLAEDLSRRDLTINALAKDMETGEIIDCFGGLHDLETKTLRHVSDAFAEDPLRVVRLARFAARYSDFKIAAETEQMAIKVCASGEMNYLPYERYWLEVEKTLADNGDISKFFKFIKFVGGFEHIEFFKDVWGTAAAIPNIERIAHALHYPPGEDKLAMFVALTAKKDLAKLKGAPNKMFAIHSNLQRINEMVDLDAASIFELMKTTKAWSQSTLINDVVFGAQVNYIAGHVVGIYPWEISACVIAVRAITSDKFQHLDGKAIGAAMEQARKEAIENMIKEILT